MKPIVVLNSGGFDSVVMLHELCEHYPKNEIHTLFFDYGQRSLEQERHCAMTSSERLRCVFHEVKIPPISWTKGKFYDEKFMGVQEQYLEMRNMIFLSYALSLCESIGANRLYSALMKPPPLNSGYPDASLDFVQRFNDLAVNTAGVNFFAPLMEYEKEDLISWVSHHKITPNSFSTCDTPIYDKESGKYIRCGVCTDCRVLKKIFPKTY